MSQLETIKKLGKTVELSNCVLRRVDLDDEHYYFMDTEELKGEFCVSMTHVLDIGAPFPEGLRQWLKYTDAKESTEIFESAGNRGSKLHDALEQLASGIELDLEKDYTTTYEKEAITTFARWWYFLQPDDFALESTVADPELKVAGTMDLVCTVDSRKLDILLDPTYKLEIDSEDHFVLKEKHKGLLDGEPKPIRVIIDYKFTGRNAYNHKVQVAGYTHMYNQSYADEPDVERKFTWRYSPKHKLGFDMQESELGYDSYRRIYDTFIEYLGGFPQPPKITVYPKKLKLLEVK